MAKRQTRLAGLDDRILGLYAGGMSVRDIESHLSDLYGVEIKRDTISRVTDAVLEDVAAWRTRPLDAVYPIAYFDCLMVKVREDRSVRTRACYLAIGVTCEGDREVLGIWWQETEGSKFWLAVLNDLHHRGVQDVLVACVDGLTGFPEAIEAVFPQAWVQAARAAAEWRAPAAGAGRPLPTAAQPPEPPSTRGVGSQCGHYRRFQSPPPEPARQLASADTTNAPTLRNYSPLGALTAQISRRRAENEPPTRPRTPGH